MSARAAAACLALIAAASLHAGCASVAPWERDRLAEPQMAAEPEPALRLYREHVYRSREAAGAARVDEGGGCGCY